MASSLIHINEATESDLQKLPGIGPKRAASILTYRKEVAPLRNILDLSAAAGISLKAARALENGIVFDPSQGETEVSFYPALALALGSLWLTGSGLAQLVATANYATGLFDLAMALVLAGALSILLSISFEAMNISFLERRWVIVAGPLLILLGLGTLLVLAVWAPAIITTVRGTLNFIVFGLLMIWILYGPHLILRLCTGEEREGLLAGLRRMFDLTISVAGVIALLLLMTNNSDTLLEEIFAIWCVIILAVKGSLLRTGKSAFDSMLPDADRERAGFAMRRTGSGTVLTGMSYRAAAIITWITALLLALVTFSLWS